MPTSLLLVLTVFLPPACAELQVDLGRPIQWEVASIRRGCDDGCADALQSSLLNPHNSFQKRGTLSAISLKVKVSPERGSILTAGGHTAHHTQPLHHL